MKKSKRYVRICAALLCAVLCLSVNVAPAMAAKVTQADIDALKGNAASLDKKQKEIQSKLNGLKNDKAAAVQKKTLLDDQIANTNAKISNTEAQISDYNALISQAETELADAQQREEAQYELFCKRVREMEERGTISYWSVLFKANSFSDLLGSLDFINEVMDYDRRVIQDLQTLQAEIAEKKAGLEANKAALEAAKAELETQKKQLSAQRDEANKLVKEIDDNAAEYQATLKEAVDPALLQQALDAARPLAEYYFCHVVWEKREARLEPNTAPCRVRQGSAQPKIPEETNDYLFSLGYEGNTVYLDWFHFLADGRGSAPFFTLLLKLYCNLRSNAGFVCEALASDPPYDVEQLLARCPESQVANDMQKDVLQIHEGTPHFQRLRLDRQSLVDLAQKEGVKPFSALMGLTCQAAQRYLEKNDLVYSYAADTRAALGVPHALYNCIASFQLSLQLEPQARFHSFAKRLDHEIRESLTPERRLFRMAEQMGWVYQVFRQKAALKIKKRVFQMGEYISGFPADFWVSYIGSPLLPHSPELEAYLTDFQTWVLPDGASLAMEVTSLHGVLTCCIENKVDKPGYLEALRDVMEQEGIRVLEAVHIS